MTAPDLIVADVNGKTLRLLDWLRGADSALCEAATDTPVIVLTSSDQELHRVRLLERGADDVIVKPVSYPELRARIAAVLRRAAPRQPRPVLSAGPVRIDLRDRSVSADERAVELSALEYRLLCQLATEPTQVFSHRGSPDDQALVIRQMLTHRVLYKPAFTLPGAVGDIVESLRLIAGRRTYSGTSSRGIA
jgi:DNA-binding response OmpR family regulator